MHTKLAHLKARGAGTWAPCRCSMHISASSREAMHTKPTHLDRPSRYRRTLQDTTRPKACGSRGLHSAHPGAATSCVRLTQACTCGPRDQHMHSSPPAAESAPARAPGLTQGDDELHTKTPGTEPSRLTKGGLQGPAQHARRYPRVHSTPHLAGGISPATAPGDEWTPDPDTWYPALLALSRHQQGAQQGPCRAAGALLICCTATAACQGRARPAAKGAP